jgi:hypothetical protein
MSAAVEEAHGRLFVLPFRGEFGIKLLRHVCRVHAIKHPNKLVVCEEGDEALYPSARSIINCARNVDHSRRDQPSEDSVFVQHFAAEAICHLLVPGDSIVWPSFSGPTEYFVPKPYVNVNCTVTPDVVICPRKRAYGSSKNWPYWWDLVKHLSQLGIRSVVAAGGQDNSDRNVEKLLPCSWTFPRTLDRTLDWMGRAKVVLATDSGLAHLSVWCGKHLVLISHGNGLVAPGPVADETGRVLRSQYWPINQAQYESENHLKSKIEVLSDSWHNPRSVASRIHSILTA